MEADQAAKQLLGASVAAKNELLFQNGINFNDLPVWQKRGIGFYWQVVPKEGHNPQTGEIVITERQSIKVDYETASAYGFERFLLDLIDPRISLHRDAILVDESQEQQERTARD